MTRRLRLRELGLVLTIFAVLGAGIFASACGTVAGAGQDKAGNMAGWLRYSPDGGSVGRPGPDPTFLKV
jgi:predicted small secreted protein